MKYTDIKKVTTLNNYCLVKKTEESIDAENGTNDFDKTQFYLKNTPMGVLYKKDPKSDIDVEESQYVLYRKLSEQGIISINGIDYTILNDSNLIAKVDVQ